MRRWWLMRRLCICPRRAWRSRVAAAIEWACGLAILAGFRTRFAAWLLFLYLIPVTYFFHNFWAVQGQEQQMQMINFLKNVGDHGRVAGAVCEWCWGLFGGREVCEEGLKS